MTLQNETYLGDGVYAGHDGYQVWIRVGGGLDEPGRPIALEPEVLSNLINYANTHLGFTP